MATFRKCDQPVSDMANAILTRFESHKPILNARVRIDYVFAYGERDDEGNLISRALVKGGVPALGITRKLPLKDRAMGRGDAEIALDHDHWSTLTEAQQEALLDHELHHIQVKTNKSGVAKTDDLNRPLLTLRKHDVEVGWFNVIAERHQHNSTERIQAAQVMEAAGQLYWPALSYVAPATAAP